MAYTDVNKTSSNGIFSSLANPVLRKLDKNGEFASEHCATYRGIVSKTVFFLIVTVIGVLLCFILHNLFLSSGSESIYHFVDEKNGVYDLTFHAAEGIILGVVILIDLITPFLAWLIRPTIPVAGTLYALAQGMLVGYITVALAPEYKYLSLLAMIITISLVAVMLFVYAKRIITVTARFRGILASIFFGIILAGIIFFILSLIPAVRNTDIYTGISSVLNNPAVSVIISIVFVIIASLFMLADFDTIERCVENRVDKKYEWMAAWGLVYTILYIYFKILRILITLLGNGKKSSSS